MKVPRRNFLHLAAGATALEKLDVAAAPSPRYGPNMCYDSKRGTLVLYGGGSSTRVFSTDTWEHSEGP